MQAKVAKSETKVVAKPAAKVAAKPAADDEADVVKKIEVDGVKYLKSKKSGVIYDYRKYVDSGEQIVVGKWNDAKNKIEFTNNGAESGEESEDDYDN